MIKHVIFDWSGVISNDLKATFQTYNLLFHHYGVPEISIQTFQKTFELPYSKFVAKHLPQVPLKEIQAKFREFFPTVAHTPHLIGGVRRVLRALKIRKITMAVLSSHSYVRAEADAFFSGEKFFAYIFEDIPNKHDFIHALLKLAKFQPQETLFVGDMVHDIEAGKKAGVLTAGILTGYQSRKILSQANPDFIFPKLHSILKVIDSSIGVS